MGWAHLRRSDGGLSFPRTDETGPGGIGGFWAGPEGWTILVQFGAASAGLSAMPTSIT